MILTPEQRAFLEKPHFAVVATIADDGMPHQTVMWYALEGEGLLLNTPSNSLKHRHLQRDPRLSVCVQEGYQYVTLKGTVQLVEEAESAGADYARLGQRYRDTFAARPPLGSPAMSARTQELLSRSRVTLHLRVEKVHSNGLS